jgi:hypothetical protein
MTNVTRRTIGQAWRMSSRVRLLFVLVAGVGALGLGALTFAPVAHAAFWVQFVGSGNCAEKVWPGSDQIDDGWSNNYEVDSYTLQDQCSIFEVQGSMRVYLRKTDGTNACSGTGFGHVTCVAPGYPYTRAHCVNTSGSSIRWMACYKYRS